MSAILLGWWIATLPFAVDFRTSLWGASGRGNGLVLHVALLGLFAGIAAMRIGADGIRRLLRAMLAILAVVSAYAVVQAAGLDLFVWPNVRPGSTIGHPVPLAAILALGVPIGLAMAASSRTRKTLAVVGAVTALMVFALGTTLSRGPWIGAVCGTAVTIALMLRVSGGQRSRMAAISAAAVIAVGATVWLARVPGTRVTQRIALIARATTDPSFMNRFEYFSAALAMIRQRPVTGSGFETFGLLFPPLRPVENLTVDEDTIPTMVHNGYLDRSVWTGSPGLLLYVALMAVVGAVLVQAIRRRENTNGDDRRMLACGILGGLVAFWIQDLSGWEEVSSSVFFWVVAGLGVCLSAHSGDVQFDARGHKPTSVNRRVASVALALCALLLGACSWTVWRETYADAQITGARRIGVGSGWREARAILEETRPLVAHDASSLDRIAVVYLDRLRATPDPEAYRTVRDVLREAGASTRFNPYISRARCRRRNACAVIGADADCVERGCRRGFARRGAGSEQRNRARGARALLYGVGPCIARA